MMKKRGQLTIFIIIAILVVVLIIFFFLMQNDFMSQPIEGSEIVLASVLACVEYTTKNSLYFVSFQGGYNTPPETHFSFSPTFFPYYYYEGEDLMPSLPMIEYEIAEFVDENLEKCFNLIESGNFEISYSRPKSVDVNIRKEGVEYKIDMPITIRKDGKSMVFELSEFPMTHETRLYDIYQTSRFFINDQLDNPEDYCISCLAKMSADAGIKFYLFPLIDDVYIIMAYENKPNPVVFQFVNKYLPEN